MKPFEGKVLQDSEAVHACQLDGKGGIKPISAEGMVDSANPCWLHLDYSLPGSARWLNETLLLPDGIRNLLAGESARPRVTRLGEGTLINLRSINLNADSRPDQLVAVRVFITDTLIISTRRRKIAAINDVLTDLQEGNGPTDSGSWLVFVAEALTYQTSEFIDDLLEQKIPARGTLALIRKQLIVLRRYMTPQRDVFSRLSGERLAWMGDDDRRRMQEIAERLGRGLDDLDASVARTTVLADEITSQMTEALNRRTYSMSVLAMIFLSTAFLTGLFGVNLGGIPGGGSSMGFINFCVMLLVLVGGVDLWLKRSKWL
ncbi:zinc transporter ZntB [Candidatus Symbiopectobacterium sp. 'North America']|uniref:zinc transporter ZntB n=1 Tax=Candidatus Symbiopectobacterium sp. 'North America' TaxID=2794574 RepID=UPI0018C95B32|nr:zinc transporter ZntB [Candidatus Symbiopectobacterium sp. 'North America']MBG6245289.1 zinc transporter ZntB [Candidatus Symbiopectobacterium sp. 'North America']